MGLTSTSQIRIGVSVLVMLYRHPAVIAKMLATADLLSKGRIVLGAGGGWRGLDARRIRGAGVTGGPV